MKEQVYESMEYDKFKLLLGNRSVNDAHVAEIILSMKENGNFRIPIIVNRGFEILDGQHRYFAWVHLKLPIIYIMRDGELREAQLMNIANKNWKDSDFLESYLGLDLPEYKKYKEFKDKYEFGHSTNIMLLTGSTHTGGRNGPKRKDDPSDLFRRGTFVVKRWTEACAIADFVCQFEPYYDGYRRRSFITACRLLFKTPKFSPETMIRKIQFQSSSLLNCGETIQYVEILVRIYNKYTSAPERISIIRDGVKIALKVGGDGL